MRLIIVAEVDEDRRSQVMPDEDLHTLTKLRAFVATMEEDGNLSLRSRNYWLPIKSIGVRTGA
jgi:hypothetical protein